MWLNVRIFPILLHILLGNSKTHSCHSCHKVPKSIGTRPRPPSTKQRHKVSPRLSAGLQCSDLAQASRVAWEPGRRGDFFHALSATKVEFDTKEIGFCKWFKDILRYLKIFKVDFTWFDQQKWWLNRLQQWDIARYVWHFRRTAPLGSWIWVDYNMQKLIKSEGCWQPAGILFDDLLAYTYI